MMNEYPESLQLVKNSSLHFGYTNFVEDHEYGFVYIKADAVPKPSYLPWIICAIIFAGEVFGAMADANYWWAGFMGVAVLSTLGNIGFVYKDRKKIRDLIYADPS